MQFHFLYRSPNQLHDVFDKITNKNPYLIVILGLFTANSSNWSKLYTTTNEGSKIDAVTSQFAWFTLKHLKLIHRPVLI